MSSSLASGTAPPERLRDNRDFLNFAVSRFGTVCSSYVLTVIVGWELYVRTGSPLLLGMVGLAKFLPFLLFFLPAGVIADRFDRRRIITASNAAQAVASLGIGMLLMMPGPSILPLFAFLFLHGAAQAFLHPAIQSTLPNIVSRTLFPRAVAASVLVTQFGQLLAPALAGGLLATIGSPSIFAAFVFALIGAVAADRIRTDLRISAPDAMEVGAFLGGLRYVWNNPVVLGSVSLDLIAVLFGSIVALLPIFAIDVLDVGPGALGAMRAAPAVGALVMGLALLRVAAPRWVGPRFFTACFGFGLAVLIFSLSETLWLSLAALCLYGATDMYSVYVRHALVQLFTPDQLRGRVNAANGVVLFASNELGDARAGFMAAAVGAVPTAAVGAVVTLVATVLWWRMFSDLRRIDRI